MKIIEKNYYSSPFSFAFSLFKKFPYFIIFLVCLVLGVFVYLFTSVISVPGITPWLNECSGSGFFCLPTYVSLAVYLILIGGICGGLFFGNLLEKRFPKTFRFTLMSIMIIGLLALIYVAFFANQP